MSELQYKDSEVGRIPKDWEVRQLNEVAAVIDPHPSHRAPPEVGTGIPFVGIGDVKETGELDLTSVRRVGSDVFFKHSKHYQISDNTIGFGRVASVGKVVDFRKFAFEVTISPTLAIIEPGNVQKKYLVNILRSDTVGEQISFLQSGSTRLSLGIELLRTLRIPMPPFPQQQKIASILTAVDEVIEKTEAQIEKLQDLKTAMMNELLTKGIGHTEYKDSELGRIPKSWDVGFLGNYAEKFYQGINTAADRVVYENQGVPIIQMKHITNGRISTDGARFIGKADYLKYKENFNPLKGDIFLSNIGTIGVTALVESDQELLFHWNIFLIRVTEEIEATYLHYYLQRLRYLNYYDALTTGNATQFVNKKALFKIHVPLPSLAEQKKIASILTSIDTNIEEKQSKLEQTQSLKKSLMQDLLTGKVRVQVN